MHYTKSDANWIYPGLNGCDYAAHRAPIGRIHIGHHYIPTLTPNQAAKKLGISRRTIMRIIAQYKLHTIRDNRNQW